MIEDRRSDKVNVEGEAFVLALKGRAREGGGIASVEEFEPVAHGNASVWINICPCVG